MFHFLTCACLCVCLCVHMQACTHTNLLWGSAQMLICSCRERKKTSKTNKKPRNKCLEERSAVSLQLNRLLTWFSWILMILLVSKLAKSVQRQSHEMPVTIGKIEMHCLVLDLFSSLQLCAMQAVATSLYCMHLTKTNICYMYLYFFISGSVSLRSSLQCRIWVCMHKELVLLVKGGLQIHLEGEWCIAFIWHTEQGSCSDDLSGGWVTAEHAWSCLQWCLATESSSLICPCNLKLACCFVISGDR